MLNVRTQNIIVTDELKGDRALVSERNLWKLEDQIKKLNRRAARLKVEPLKLIVDRNMPVITYLDPELGQYGPVRRSFFVSLEGSTPRVEGYTLIAKLEGTEHGNVIKTLIRTDLPEEFRTRSTCDQCKTDRYRKDTFVLRDKSGAFTQVGRNCLADYLRSEDHAAWLVELAELRLNIVQLEESDPDGDDDMPRGRRVETQYALIRVLELAAAAIRAHGWVSAKKAREMETSLSPVESTAGRVNFHFQKVRDQGGRLIGQIEVIDEDKELAAGALKWIEDETNRSNLSDYLHNCKMLIAGETITAGHIGIASSIIAMHAKRVEKLREETLQFGSANAYIGAEKERITVNAKLTKVFNYETDGYGYRASAVLMAIYIFRTVEGHTLTWKTEDRKLIIGADYKVTGTIKAHEHYKGTNQTVLTRCKLESGDRRFAPVLAYSPATPASPSSSAYAARHHIDDALTGKSGNMDKAKWVKLFKELVAKHGKPSIKLDDCMFHVIFDWR